MDWVSTTKSSYPKLKSNWTGRKREIGFLTKFKTHKIIYIFVFYFPFNQTTNTRNLNWCLMIMFFHQWVQFQLMQLGKLDLWPNMLLLWPLTNQNAINWSLSPSGCLCQLWDKKNPAERDITFTKASECLSQTEGNSLPSFLTYHISKHVTSPWPWTFEHPTLVQVNVCASCEAIASIRCWDTENIQYYASGHRCRVTA